MSLISPGAFDVDGFFNFSSGFITPMFYRSHADEGEERDIKTRKRGSFLNLRFAGARVRVVRFIAALEDVLATQRPLFS